MKDITNKIICFDIEVVLENQIIGGNKMREKIIKNISFNFPRQVHEGNLIILGSDGELSVLNDTSKFLYENCDNENICTLTRRLIDACVEKDELDEEAVEIDVVNVITKFEEMGFIIFQNKV